MAFPRSLGVFALGLLVLTLRGHAAAPETKTVVDLAYKSGGKSTAYEKTRCKLDVYAPRGAKDLPCLVWFHGGNLVAGGKDAGDVVAVARTLAGEGIVVAVANYRLSPQASYPAYLEDAAAAVAWMHEHARDYGADPGKLFIGGHSAGGYLTAMLGADDRWLQKQGMTLADIAGLISLSGQMFTHCTVRAERGLPVTTVVIDDAAPVNHATQKMPPLLLLYAERDLPFRGAENRYFAEALGAAGNDHFTIRLMRDRDHGSINSRIPQPGDDARGVIVDFVRNSAAARP